MSDFIVIAHRGNVNGKQSTLENGQRYCQKAIDAGYNVEIDVHWYDGIFWTGHDKPQYRVNTDFLKKDEVWCHAKDIQALYKLQKIDAHCFFHERDAATLTTKGYIWTFPLEKLTINSICVMPELQRIQSLDKCAGVCTDHADSFKVGN